MRWFQKGMAVLLSLLLMFAFVQITGTYLVGQLSQYAGQVPELEVKEQVRKQMVLQLEPLEYYTFQIGSYQNTADGQDCINALAQMGYRVCVSEGPPYELWLGCLGKEPDLDELPESIRSISSDIFIRRRILNETAMKFSADDGQIMDQVAALFSSYDVVLKHSLQMFQDYRYDACSEENWADMTAQITGELTVIQDSAAILLADENSEELAANLLDLLSATEEYSESLTLMQEKKNDRVVLLAQSCLLELIEQYHNCMESAEQE